MTVTERENPSPEVTIVTPEEFDTVIESAIHSAGLSVDDIRNQALSGNFSSDEVEDVWCVVKSFVR
ncbi:MAG: hypothetical protein GEU79_11680 [Acidimicrobiia bacterium]|nr:hypothetical protein [Acidimicrobiia bacterium]